METKRLLRLQLPISSHQTLYDHFIEYITYNNVASDCSQGYDNTLADEFPTTFNYSTFWSEMFTSFKLNPSRCQQIDSLQFGGCVYKLFFPDDVTISFYYDDDFIYCTISTTNPAFELNV